MVPRVGEVYLFVLLLVYCMRRCVCHCQGDWFEPVLAWRDWLHAFLLADVRLESLGGYFELGDYRCDFFYFYFYFFLTVTPAPPSTGAALEGRDQHDDGGANDGGQGMPREKER